MWLNINDRYSVSDNGEIRNDKTGRILKQFTQGLYHGVKLGAGNTYYIHHIVAERFLPQPTEDNLCIDHIDRNKYNNSASNLRWVNHQVNMQNRTNETKARKNSKLKELYIYMDRNSYCVKRKGIRKNFKSLDEAKQFRDSNINALKTCP